uniref:Sas10 domain-containing protein n=1 Tax=Panagrellus redivivus TaxID=6233 RepID=A0A7E4UXH0_PANRE
MSNAEANRSPVETGFVQTKRGRFARKKNIETNLGPDGKPVYTGAQLESAVGRMKSRKEARKEAKEEEKNYVEYRKAEILRAYQPKVGILRVGDDAFPKRRRLAMGFGERKAHYLAIRPKAKYATWIGRKKGVIEAKPKEKKTVVAKAIVTDHSMLPDQSVRTTRETHKMADEEKKHESEDKDVKDKPAAETKDEKKPSAETTAKPEEKKVRKYDFRNPTMT